MKPLRYAALLFLFACIAASPCRAENQDECMAAIDTGALKTGIIIGYKMEGRIPVVYVNERLWAKMPFELKEGMAEKFDCAIAGPGKSIPNTQYRGNISGKTLAIWDGLKLIPQ